MNEKDQPVTFNCILFKLVDSQMYTYKNINGEYQFDWIHFVY